MKTGANSTISMPYLQIEGWRQWGEVMIETRSEFMSIVCWPMWPPFLRVCPTDAKKSGHEGDERRKKVMEIETDEDK